MADLWIFTNRPNTLVDCLAAAHVLRPHFSRARLVYQEDKPWARANWDEFKSAFDSILALPKARPPRGLLGVLGYTAQLKELLRKVGGLGIAPDDVFVCLTILTPLGQSVVSLYPGQFKVLCTTEKKARDLRAPFDRNVYRFTTGGWFNYRFIEPLLGLRRIYNLKTRRPQAADGERLRRFAEDPRSIYRAALVYHNDITQAAPENQDGFFHACPFPNISFLRKQEGSSVADRQWVVFFGTPFLLLKNLPPETYRQILNDCLEYLRRSYPASQLIYRPHPFESGEQQQLNLEKFEIQNDKEAAELFMLRHSNRIEAVYTVSSTVSRTAMNYGFNAYVLWPLFPFQPRTADFFRDIMGAVPEGFNVRRLDRPPSLYATPGKTQAAFEQYSAILKRTLQIKEKP